MAGLNILDPSPPSDGDKNSPLKKHATSALTIGALITAIYGASKPETAANKAIKQNVKGYEQLREDVKRLQKWAHYNRRRAKRAEESCKAQSTTMTALVTGFMFGSGAKKKPGAGTAAFDSAALQSFIKALQAAATKKSDDPEPPKLKAPPPAAKALK